MPDSIKIRELLLGSILTVLILLGFNYPLEPVPYTDVDRLSLSKNDETIYYMANFYKHNCEFSRLGVYIEDLGVWERILLIDSQEPRDGDVGDRIEGEQTLNLEIPYVRSSRYEIRTEHDCGNKNPRVGKIFDQFTYKDIQ